MVAYELRSKEKKLKNDEKMSYDEIPSQRKELNSWHK
jgi:Spy/CpxP family protein refolding chaperone